jgi:phosphopantetheinyl transferase (holo-ACP synthase)
VSYCRNKQDPIIHFAGTLAAKEAVIKALRLGPLMAWTSRIEITRDDEGVPRARIDGAARPVEISIAHDYPVAVATALKISPDG